MTDFGYFLSSEEFGPHELIAQAEEAAAHGFTALAISDHFHPWLDTQGQSPFVWSTLGAVARLGLPAMTAVTCPTTRTHPALIAQAAATTAVLYGGGFVLGVGTGEALNEHVLGDVWPAVETRLRQLEEAVEVMRELWTGDLITRSGEFYDVDTARIYTLPDAPPPVYMSAFGTKAAELAGRIADGLVSTSPDREAIETFRESGGGGKPVVAAMKVCYAPTAEEAAEIRHRLWPNEGLPGQLAQELPLPSHFEQACELVTKDAVASSTVVGPDAERHVKALREFVDLGFDTVHVGNIGPYQEEFFTFYESEVLPELRR